MSVAEKHDISHIFDCLSDDRKVAIIDAWPYYLDQILKIRKETYEKRRENIMTAIRNINNIVNEAILRKKQQEEMRVAQRTDEAELMRNAETYDQMRRANQLQQLIRKNNEKAEL